MQSYWSALHFAPTNLPVLYRGMPQASHGITRTGFALKTPVLNNITVAKLHVSTLLINYSNFTSFMKCWLMGQRELFYYNYYDFGFPSQFNKRLSVKNICYWNDVIICYYPIPAPSSSTSFPLMDGNILKTSGCSCCVRCLALLSSIISSTLWAKECLFQNSIISSRVWADTAAATKKVLLVLTHFGVYYAIDMKTRVYILNSSLVQFKNIF